MACSVFGRVIRRDCNRKGLKIRITIEIEIRKEICDSATMWTVNVLS